jgi:hypothetical protein
MRLRNAVAAALISSGLVIAVPSGAEAKPSVVSGVEIPFPVVDTMTGCATTGRLQMYPDITPGLVATEQIKAIVSSSVCPVTWTVRVVVIDNSPGFPAKITEASGTGSASAELHVTYATAATPAPTPVRGAARVSFRTSWLGSNGVSGCVINDWVVASFADAYEIGPVVPCDDRVQFAD